MKNYQTWKYNVFPSRQKASGLKWVFRVKYNINGLIAKFKAKLVAQSFSQILSIDFAKIFVPIIRKKFLQIYLVFYLIFNLFIHQVDIVEVYMKNFFGNNKFPIFIKLILKIEYL